MFIYLGEEDLSKEFYQHIYIQKANMLKNCSNSTRYGKKRWVTDILADNDPNDESYSYMNGRNLCLKRSSSF
jgi:hypothetical protein